MTLHIASGKVAGIASVPSSKSILQRTLIAALLAEGITTLHATSHCADSLACLSAIQLLGAKVETNANGMITVEGVAGKINSPSVPVDCGESGFALRALAFVAALAGKEITLTGHGSLLQRPVDFFEKVFPSLGVKCKSTDGFIPLQIQGPLSFRNHSINGSMSSQFLSGMLMVYPLADKEHVIEVQDLKSRQYVDLTIQVLEKYGVTVMNEGYKRFGIPGGQRYKPFTGTVENDWSAAAFMLVAGATAGVVTIENLNGDSLQPDKLILKVLEQCGAAIENNSHAWTVKSTVSQARTTKSRLLKPFAFDATDSPDLFPPLVALAIRCDGTSEITGVERLIHKESNRALALQLEFSKLNKNLIRIEGNKMLVTGGLELQSAEVDAHNDHRIAMALAIAALNVEGGLWIKGYESVAKSFPQFFAELEKLKTEIKVTR